MGGMFVTFCVFENTVPKKWCRIGVLLGVPSHPVQAPVAKKTNHNRSKYGLVELHACETLWG
jgi:hypothetical protein